MTHNPSSSTITTKVVSNADLPALVATLLQSEVWFQILPLQYKQSSVRLKNKNKHLLERDPTYTYVVHGRAPGDDDDTVMDFTCKSEAEAIELFKEKIHQDTDKDDLARIIDGYSDSIILVGCYKSLFKLIP